jgi:glycosyltransferase involved in cell wall biosynthesis
VAPSGRPLEILHVITSLERAGAQTVLARLVQAQGSAFHHTVACLREEGFYASVLRAHGAEVVALGMPAGRVTLSGLRALAGTIRRAHPDVVQTWMYHADLIGGLIARLSGFRSIVWGIRNSDLDPSRTKASTRLVVRLCGWLSGRLPAAIVSCSERARDIHVDKGYEKEKFVVIPNGCDVSLFRPDEDARRALRSEWGVPERQPLVGMVARWDPQKDHANFLAAAARVAASRPAARFALAGPDMTPDNRPLVALVDAAGLREAVFLLGPRADVPAVMSALDLHVLSSAYGEAFPNVVMEAMACGIPCVVTDVGDAAYIVGDAGWTVPPEDSELLAGAVDRALAMSVSDRGALASRCRERIARHFTISQMAEAYVAIWRRVSQDNE